MFLILTTHFSFPLKSYLPLNMPTHLHGLASSWLKAFRNSNNLFCFVPVTNVSSRYSLTGYLQLFLLLSSLSAKMSKMQPTLPTVAPYEAQSKQKLFVDWVSKQRLFMCHRTAFKISWLASSWWLACLPTKVWSCFRCNLPNFRT